MTHLPLLPNKSYDINDFVYPIKLSILTLQLSPAILALLFSATVSHDTSHVKKTTMEDPKRATLQPHLRAKPEAPASNSPVAALTQLHKARTWTASKSAASNAPGASAAHLHPPWRLPWMSNLPLQRDTLDSRPWCQSRASLHHPPSRRLPAPLPSAMLSSRLRPAVL